MKGIFLLFFYEPLINVNNVYVNFVTIVYNFEFSFLKTFDFVANRIWQDLFYIFCLELDKFSLGFQFVLQYFHQFWKILFPKNDKICEILLLFGQCQKSRETLFTFNPSQAWPFHLTYFFATWTFLAFLPQCEPRFGSRISRINFWPYFSCWHFKAMF